MSKSCLIVATLVKQHSEFYCRYRELGESHITQTHTKNKQSLKYILLHYPVIPYYLLCGRYSPFRTLAFLQKFLLDFRQFSYDICHDVFSRESVRRKASTCTEQYNTKLRGKAFISRVGFEPMIPVFHQPTSRIKQSSLCGGLLSYFMWATRV
jgi:hypothetical protein